MGNKLIDVNQANENLRAFEREAIRIGFLICGACLLFEYIVLWRIPSISYLKDYFSSSAVALAVFVCLLNLKSWRFFAFAFLYRDTKKSSDNCLDQTGQGAGHSLGARRQFFIFLLLKTLVLVGLIFLVFYAEKREIVSFLLGFTGFLFLAIVLPLVFRQRRLANQ